LEEKKIIVWDSTDFKSQKDLIDLPVLNEASLLFNLKQRYQQHNIYVSEKRFKC